MRHQRTKRARHHRQRQLEHDLVAHRIQLLEHFHQQQLVAGRAAGAGDVHFRLEDRHQSAHNDLTADFELLRDNCGDPGGIGRLDHRTFFGAIDTERLRAREQRVQFGHRLHQLDAVCFVFQTFVDLDERDDPLGDQRGGDAGIVNCAVHCPLEQDRADHLVAVEHCRADDPAAHGVDQAEHFLVVAPRPGLDPVTRERLGGRAARLVQRGDEALPCGHLGGHFSGVHGPASFVIHTYAAAPIAALPGRRKTANLALSARAERGHAGQVLAFHPFQKSAASG